MSVIVSPEREDRPRTLTPASPGVSVQTVAPWVGFVVGAGLVAAAYVVAHNAPYRIETRYLLFWLGMGLGLGCALWRLLNPLAHRLERFCLVLGVGVLTFLPKFLRNPSRPLFFDELAHWSQSEQLHRDGKLLETNGLVKVIRDYPGLHIVTDSIRQLTGLSTWHVAVLLVLCAHLLSLLAIFRIAHRLTGNERTASIAALAYAVNPAFFFFDAQYAYETLGITLLLWCLTCTLESLGFVGPHVEKISRRTQTAWAGLAVFLAAGVVLTHHLSGYVLAAILGIVTASAAFNLRGGTPLEGEADTRNPVHVAGFVAATTLVMAIVWMLVSTRGHPSQVLDYLTVQPFQAIGNLLHLGKTGNSRRVFVNGGLPFWVRLIAFFTPIAAVALAAKGWWSVRSHGELAHPAFDGFGMLGAIYAISLPFVLTRNGSEAAHRFFPFSWIGLSVLIGAGIVAFQREAWLQGVRRGHLVEAGLILTLVLLAIGSIASESNDYYMFPGPYVAGSDTRADDAELTTIADWFATQHITSHIATDVWAGAPIVAQQHDPKAKRLGAIFPGRAALWFVYFNEHLDPYLLNNFSKDGYGYLVVDRRMATDLPFNQYWFTADEPGAYHRTKPVPLENLLRFDRQAWAHRVFATEHFDVYRLDFASKGTRAHLGPDNEEVGSPTTTTTRVPKKPTTTTTTTVPTRGSA
jgi:hypothetical protein